MKFIKFFTLIAATALALSVTSCKKDSESTGNYGQLIVGTWNLSTVSMPGQGIGDVSASAMGMSLSYTFNSDGSWTGHASGSVPTQSGSGTYSLSGKTLMTWDQYGDEGIGGQITSMTGSKMVLNAEAAGMILTFVR